MPKATPTRRPPSNGSSNPKQRHYTPLHQELQEDEKLARLGKVKSADGGKGKGRKARGRGEGDDGLEKIVVEGEAEGDDSRTTSSRMSRKILDLAKAQQQELELEEDDEWEDDENDQEPQPSTSIAEPSRSSSARRAIQDDDDGDEDAGGEYNEDEEEEVEEYEMDEMDLNIDPEDYTTLDAIARHHASSSSSAAANRSTKQPGGTFTSDLDDALPLGAQAPGLDNDNDEENDGEPKTLADIIFAKLAEADAAQQAGSGGNSTGMKGLGGENGKGTVGIPERRPDGTLDPRVGLNPKVVEVYTKVGLLLSRYKSGPLPRALKILPSLPHWAQLLSLTSPPTWTPHATFACTRIFVSNLKPDQVRVYLQGILLDRVRENMADLASAKSGKKGVRLDSQLYEALKKALYKPAAFFKGILFPLCEEACSLREATIIASVLSKVSVPVLHSAAALLRLAGMDYAGPNSLFIRVLLDKKYALPYKVVDALVFHFIRLANSPRSRDGEDKLPVLWHQSLLVFVQRYGSDLTPDQKDALLDVIRARPHPQISSEIRREIISSVVRGEPRPEEAMDGDVEMR